MDDTIDFDLTMPIPAAELCPVFPGAQRIHWSVWDPGNATGSYEEKLAAFCRVRDELAARLNKFILSNGTAENS